MPKKIKKGISGFLVGCLIFASMVSFFAIYKDSHISADSAAPATSVTVSNAAPTVSVAAHESPASYGTAPTNVGANVTFQITGTDTNGDAYYLAVCKAAGVTPGTAGAAPTCNSGTWAITPTTTASGAEATVTYTVTASETNQTYAWFAYVCDNNAGGALCSTVSQGSSDSGSPFSVNHRPTFTTVGNNGPKNPGAADLTITATSYNDTDTDGAQDTVSMYVCKAADFTGSACGAGGTWCSVTGVTPTATLACNLTIPNPQAHGTMNYYPYIMDSHSFQASGGQQGATNTFTVSDKVPTISGTPTLNGAAAITLTSEKSTTTKYISGVITDDNGCGDVEASTTVATAWQTSLTYASCVNNTNPNKCYYQVSCALDTGTNACSGGNDKDVAVTCAVAFQYYANPTDASTPWSADNWTGTLIPGDGSGANAAGKADTAAQEMNTFLALGLATSYDTIAYGSVGANANTDPLVERTRVEATGNAALDVNLSGTTMTGPGTAIPIANQRYGIGASAPAWSAGTALSGSPTAVALHTCKTGYSGTPEWKPVYWGIAIPAAQTAGAYTGTNTIEAVERAWGGAGQWCES